MDCHVYEAPHTEAKGLSRWLPRSPLHQKKGFASDYVLLYDEADNLLESRMLKANEVVDSGERLTFQAYLVDVCEPSNPSEHSVHQPKPFAVLRPNFKKSSPYSQDKKPNLAHSFASKNLSPSHKMIRVFKERELHKFAALTPDSVIPTFEGTLPLGSANNGSNYHPLINSPRDGKSGADLSRRENDKYSKDVKPLRDVNQILSILQRPNATATCSDTNPKTPMSSTKVPQESDTCKNIKVEPISPRAASRDSLPQQFMVRETSPAKTTARTMTHLNSSSPSFDLGI
ncbi:PREDICTED: uncharacterized protein LOC106315613 isoform X2 [Brassica oleracea var. oleracea]|uniref:uncharacterized protein LOC106315613 isoform X2 n=1 Tax=Brassica oleracea var. oleracea TaxID=109376 RepID=UPI0006A70816|nr:PREDICTED: uncharacterized protein LOC106315613 isoform X2 [Brassica oleracea var. oleracea]